MNILLIGNGFDLAHELPTKYTDFLEFIKVIKQILRIGKVSGIDWGNTCQEREIYLKIIKETYKIMCFRKNKCGGV